MSNNGMLGRLPLSKVRGPRDTLETNLAGPDGEVWLAELNRFLRKENTWVFPSTIPTSPELEEVIDPIVRVDRSVKPTYPEWGKDIPYSELEATGLAQFDASRVDLWLHPNQKTGAMDGDLIYNYLNMTGIIGRCAGLRDLEEIQKRGINFFRKFFKGKVLLGWRSAFCRSSGTLHVPSLFEDIGRVKVGWYWNDFALDHSCPALRFPE